MTCYFLCQHEELRPTSEEDKVFASLKTANRMSHDQEELLVLFETEHTMLPMKVSDLSEQVGVDAAGKIRSGSYSWSHEDQA